MRKLHAILFERGKNLSSRLRPKNILYFLTLFVIISCVAAPVRADEIVAVVNKDIITAKDMGDFMSFTRVQLSREYHGKELEERVQAQKMDLLNRLIEDRLILQEAKKQSVYIDDNRIKGRIDEIRRSYRSDAEYLNDLKKQGMVPADLEKRLREQMLIFAIIDREVKSKILIRPGEVTRYYSEHKEEFRLPEGRQVDLYALESEDLARTFAFHLASGEKAEGLAARYPVTVNTMTIYKGEGVKKEIEEAVLALNHGEVSKPIEVDGRHYVFHLRHIDAPRQQPLSEAQNDIHEFLYGQKMEEGFKRWMDSLKSRAYIKTPSS